MNNHENFASDHKAEGSLSDKLSFVHSQRGPVTAEQNQMVTCGHSPAMHVLGGCYTTE